MESITSLTKKLAHAKLTTLTGAVITLERGTDFSWDPQAVTVRYATTGEHATALLLHELGHALLGHGAYTTDIELVAMERAAWEQARTLGATYHVPLTDDLIEDSLDTYRDWLHARSLCPYCGATGVQAGARTYHCLNCTGTWRVNEARTCELRRYKTT